jgi:hypothetical protein
MNSWNEGYVTDIGYTYGYYHETNPAYVQTAFLNAGIKPPKILCACELGFGQGLSVNIHAASSGVSWYGTDFNPSQVAFAKDIARKGDTGAKLFDDSFEEFVLRDDLPNFDFIALHGIWSWISDKNRKLIVDFLYRKLNVGGVAYISYNVLPGWSSISPLQYLVYEHSNRLSPRGEKQHNKTISSFNFAANVCSLGEEFSKAMPGLKDILNSSKKNDPRYLSHEYFNKNSQPMYFTDIASQLEAAKLSFACTANTLSELSAINLTKDQQNFLSEIPDVNFRETIRDFFNNTRFRQDYWVRGAQPISSSTDRTSIKELRFVLTSLLKDVPEKVTGYLLTAPLQKSIYGPILEKIKNYEAFSISDLNNSIKDAEISFVQLEEAIKVLLGMRVIAPVPSAESSPLSKDRVLTLNNTLMKSSIKNKDMNYLASPVSEGAVRVPRIQQLFLLSLIEGKNSAQDMAEWVWGIFSSQSEVLVKDGKRLNSPQENIEELTSLANSFLKESLPLFRSLQVI